MDIDHLVLAAPDLAAAKDEFARACGVMPVDGGPHPGLGTRNALVAFDGGRYLEIIAPDPEQPLAGTNGERFAQMQRSELLHWAVRCEDLRAVSQHLQQHLQQRGVTPGPIRSMARNTPEGERLEWQLMGVGGHSWGGLMPFFIDWQRTPHPSRSAPEVGPLTDVVLHAEPALAAALAAVDGLTLDTGSEGMTVRFDTPLGPQQYAAKSPKGFGF